MHGEEITLMHATRPDFIASIMVDGLRTSNESHGVVGLWCKIKDADENELYDWGRTPLDRFSGCVVVLKMPKDHWKLVTSQRRLKGRGERRVVKGEKESTEIPVGSWRSSSASPRCRSIFGGSSSARASPCASIVMAFICRTVRRTKQKNICGHSWRTF